MKSLLKKFWKNKKVISTGILILILAEAGGAMHDSGPSEEIVISNRFLEWRYSPSTGYWQLLSRQQPIQLRNVFARCSLEEGELRSTDRPVVHLDQQEVTTPLGKALQVTLTHEPKGGITLQEIFTFWEESPRVTIRLALQSKGTLRPRRLDLLAVDSDGQPNVFLKSGSPPVVLGNGFQSWSESIVAPLEPGKTHTVWWNGALHSDGGSLGFGFLTSRWSKNSFSLKVLEDPRKLALEATCLFNPWEGAAGGSFESDVLELSFAPNALEGLRRYARDLQAFHQPSIPSQVPIGWCSWYFYYPNITEEEVLKNLEFLAQHLKPFGLEYVQIDDGWQGPGPHHVWCGDWEANEKFPHGMKWLADQIHKRGLKAGLWLAPFVISRNSVVHREHPEWLLRDRGGEILRMGNSRGEFILDPTHPEAAQWLRELFQRITRDWGYDYVKIDFLYYLTAHDSARFHSGEMAVQAYRKALGIIREAVGDKTFVLGCGAPLLPSIGLVDGMRIGADVAASYGGILRPVWDTATRFYLHRRLWLNDPDCLVVREPMTPGEAQTWASIVGLSGGLTITSDKMYALPPDRVAIVQSVLPVYPAGAVPLDLFQVEKRPTPLITLASDESQKILLAGSWKFQPGDRAEGARPDLDDSGWATIEVPSWWEKQGYPKLNGYAWYRLRVTIPENWKGQPLVLYLGAVDDVDQTFWNGHKIGQTGSFPPNYVTAWMGPRKYRIQPEMVVYGGENVLAVRVYDGGGAGGITEAPSFPPTLWSLKAKNDSEEWMVLGVFNWDNEPVHRLLPLDQLGLERETSYLAFDFWRQTFLGEVRDSLSLEVPAHGVRLLALRRRLGHPQVLGTDRHITQGAVELQKVQWDSARLILSGEYQAPPGKRYHLALYVPEDLQLVDWAPRSRIHLANTFPHGVRWAVDFPSKGKVAWKFQFRRKGR